jgi:hypothetical protein
VPKNILSDYTYQTRRGRKMPEENPYCLRCKVQMKQSGRKGTRWLCQECGKGCAKVYKCWKPTSAKRFQRGQIDPNRPDCSTCGHPMARDKINSDKSVHYRCHRCEKAGRHVTRARKMPTEAELVFCVKHHTRMYQSKGSDGSPCYSCRTCHITIRKYKAPKYGKRLKHGFTLPVAPKPFTMVWSEMLGASCLNCHSPLTLTLKKHAHGSVVADAYCCRKRACNFIIVVFKRSRIMPRHLQPQDLLGASCVECKEAMKLRTQKRQTQRVPTYSLLWHCEKCGVSPMVEYINHQDTRRPVSSRKVLADRKTIKKQLAFRPLGLRLDVKQAKTKAAKRKREVLRRPPAAIPGIPYQDFLRAIKTVERIVKCNLPALFREDVCQSMLTDLWEGCILLEELTPALADAYVAEQNRLFGHKNKMRSLETPVAEDENCTLGELIPG